MFWFGADPGGSQKFGAAILKPDGSFATALLSYADEAIQWLHDEPSAAGIDAPLWWSSGKSGDRQVDDFLRRQYQIASGTVQTCNSLRGAALIQGAMLAIRLRERFPAIKITETHPKALLKAMKLDRSWKYIAERFELTGSEPSSEHELDALLGAVAAREGSQKRWTRNLADDRLPSEQDPTKVAAGPIQYWWPQL